MSHTRITQLFLLSAFFSLCSTESIYYVTPDPDTPCPAEPCLTLSQYVEDAARYFTSDTTMMFLPGDHALNSRLQVTDIGSFALIGNSTSFPEITSEIVCSERVSMSFQSIPQVLVNALRIKSCGSNRSHALMLTSVNLAEVANSSFENNPGGGIQAESQSSLRLSGTVSFINNSASFGGGVALNSSFLECSGDVIFFSNTAAIDGAGLYGNSSTVNCSGKLSFVDNVAGYNGGAISINTGTLNLIGDSKFTWNLANRSGGAIYGDLATISLYGTKVFAHNVATGLVGEYDDAGDGGGISVERVADFLTISGNTTFTDNTARYYGGALSINYDYETGGCEGSIATISGRTAFVSNYGFNAGGIFVWNMSLNVEGHTTFMNNYALVGGGAITTFFANVSAKGISVFENNSASLGGAITVGYFSSYYINGETFFVNNNAKTNGGFMYVVYQSSVIIVGNSLFANNSASFGGVFMAQQSTIQIQENSIFQNNSATIYGGAINAYNANISTGDNQTFTGNTAVRGGAMSLSGTSLWKLAAETNISFTDNHAEEYGGAIYVEDVNFVYCAFDILPIESSLAGRPECFLQSYDKYNTLIFDNNTANKGGNAIFGGMLEYCYVPFGYDTGLAELEAIATFKETQDSPISSSPLRVCLCSNNQPSCNVSNSTHNVYHGQAFHISAVAVGQGNGTVASIVTAEFDSPSMAGFQRIEDQIQNTGVTCTQLTYKVFSNSSSETFKLYPEGPCQSISQTLTMVVNLLPCPAGFALSDTTFSCICAERLQPFTNTCNITDEAIVRDKNFWIGVDSTTDQLIISQNCPLDYCTTVKPIRFRPNNSDSQCNSNRTGLACGSCPQGFSLALGSSHCLSKCSDTYLALILAFAVAGIALVIFLFVSKLTVANGTISGLILYANIVGASPATFLPSGQTNILTVFIAWLNLDLGIETCFYKGMDGYAKAWLQFVFPLYLWFIVGIIIVTSKYSTRISQSLGTNPIAVLATVLLLSYTKLLRATIAVLSVTYLDYPDYTVAVWRYDANVDYVRGKHIPLFVVAVLALIFLFFPYTLFLLFGQWLVALSDKFRVFGWMRNTKLQALLQAYHAPYKAHYRFCPGLMLIIRLVLLLVFALNNPGVNLLAVTTASLGIAVLIWLSSIIFAVVSVPNAESPPKLSGVVFEKWYLDALEGSFLLNLGILAAATDYVRGAGGNQEAVAYTSVGIAFATFACITIYHVYLQLRRFCVCRQSQAKMTASMLPSNQQQPKWNDYSKYRESLLDDS